MDSNKEKEEEKKSKKQKIVDWIKKGQELGELTKVVIPSEKPQPFWKKALSVGWQFLQRKINRRLD